MVSSKTLAKRDEAEKPKKGKPKPGTPEEPAAEVEEEIILQVAGDGVAVVFHNMGEPEEEKKDKKPKTRRGRIKEREKGTGRRW